MEHETNRLLHQLRTALPKSYSAAISSTCEHKSAIKMQILSQKQSVPSNRTIQRGRSISEAKDTPLPRCAVLGRDREFAEAI